jgi:hypothetical protein
VKHALDLRKPVLLLNVGPTRADGLPGVEKIELKSSEVLRDVVRLLTSVPYTIVLATRVSNLLTLRGFFFSSFFLLASL